MDGRREYLEGFRITCDGGSLLIEATDYHASPLLLSEDDLAEFGLRFGKPKKKQRASRSKRKKRTEKET